MPDDAQIQSVIDQLGRGPAVVRQLIYEMPPELRKRRPAPGMWSAHEHAVHLPAIHPIMMSAAGSDAERAGAAHQIVRAVA